MLRKHWIANIMRGQYHRGGPFPSEFQGAGPFWISWWLLLLWSNFSWRNGWAILTIRLLPKSAAFDSIGCHRKAPETLTIWLGPFWVPCSPSAKGAHMAFSLYVDDTCPKCHKPTMRAVVELHPSNPDLALQNFECAACGPVKTKIVSLKPPARPSEAAA